MKRGSGRTAWKSRLPTKCSPRCWRWLARWRASRRASNSRCEQRMRRLFVTLGIVWATPYTLLGWLIGGVGVCTGGHARVRGRAIEFYGGAVKWLLYRLPGGQFTLALTLGHTILGLTDASL